MRQLVNPARYGGASVVEHAAAAVSEWIIWELLFEAPKRVVGHPAETLSGVTTWKQT